jgi:hypothetical protein
MANIQKQAEESGYNLNIRDKSDDIPTPQNEQSLEIPILKFPT